MIRAAALAVALTLVSGLAAAESFSWRGHEAASSTISSSPWKLIGFSSAFEAEDAYVFADAMPSLHLSPDATELAVRSDRERMTRGPESGAFTGPSSDPRIGTAFGGFVAVGPEGLAYASIGLAQDDESVVKRLAASARSLPSFVATLIAAR